MQFFTLADKQALQAVLKTGKECYEVAYNPNTVGIGGGTATPEADAIAAGYVQYYREATANLVEVIYVK